MHVKHLKSSANPMKTKNCSMKYWIIFTIIYGYIISACNGASRDDIDKLIQKICQIAKEKLHVQNTNPEDRQRILNSLKEKLTKSSQSKGFESSAYIRLIVQGVTLLAHEENYQKLCTGPASNIERRYIYGNMTTPRPTVEVSANTTNVIAPSAVNISNLATGLNNLDDKKQKEIKGLINKLEVMLKESVKKAETFEEKKEKVEHIKKSFIENYRRSRSTNSSDAVANMLIEGIELTATKVLGDDARRMAAEPMEGPEDPLVLIGEEALTEETANLLTSPEPTSTPITTMSPLFVGVTQEYDCGDTVKTTCKDLRRLDKFTCDYDGTTITSMQVCNGNIDCPDASDEKNCIQQVISRIHAATAVMSKMELSRFCFRSLIDNSLLSKQGELLAGLLNTQVKFLKKYAELGYNYTLDTTATRKNGANPDSNVQDTVYHYREPVSEIVAEVGIIVRSFSETLIGALCIGTVDKRDTDQEIDKFISLNIDEELNGTIAEVKSQWLPASCRCKGPFCANVTICALDCKRFCFQRHSLTNFNCKSVTNGLNSISLDLVCDGKLDCNDEADEANCSSSDNSMAKFEGSKTFDKIIRMLKSKSFALEYEAARMQLIELQVGIQVIQKLAMAQRSDNEQLKGQREKLFSLIEEIFEELLSDVFVEDDREKIYKFLLSISEKMISALKHTNMGNNVVISSNQCFCRGKDCAKPQCTPHCARTCSVKHILTNYACNGSVVNFTIPIDSICDGRINCPNGEDEINCSPEICRVHYFKVLRHNIKNVGEKIRGTVLGEALASWKSKVIATLTMLEKRERVTPKLMKEATLQILNELSLTFISLGNYRHVDEDRILKKFTKLSQRIIEAVKTCTN